MLEPFGTTTRDCIVRFLARKWPCSTKKIYAEVKTERGVSYQAVHKALRELEEQRVLLRKKGEYYLNPELVSTARNFWENAGKPSDDESAPLPASIIAGRYTFTKDDVRVLGIPSVFMSKETFTEVIHLLDERQLDAWAERIAKKQLNYIRTHNPTTNLLETISAFSYIDKAYFWGSAEAKEGKQVELRVKSKLFVGLKERNFYDKIFEKFMELVGYKLAGRVEFSRTMYFEKAQKQQEKTIQNAAVASPIPT